MKKKQYSKFSLQKKPTSFIKSNKKTFPLRCQWRILKIKNTYKTPTKLTSNFE